MYRSLFLILAVTGAACACLRPAVESDAVLAKYDHRDETIVVIPQVRPVRLELEEQVLTLVNQERESAGVKPLFFSPELAKAARRHSVAMARAGFFQHRGEGEPALIERVAASGMDTDHVGENIFETSGVSATVADECVEMWMHSDGHRLNLLSPEFERTGIAVGISSNGENYITEDFAH